MFCAKCGVEIKNDDRFCPKCGAPNKNCIDNSFTAKFKSISKKEKENSAKEEFLRDSSFMEITTDKKKGIKMMVPVVIVLAVIIVGLSVIPKFLRTASSQSRVVYTQRGVRAYIDMEDEASFFTDVGTIELDGSVKQAQTTPDYSKYVILGTNSTLSYKESEKTDLSKISEKVDSIRSVGNAGCFYMKEESGLAYFNFESAKETEIGFEGYDILFSAGNSSVVEVDKTGQLYVFSEGNDTPVSLCNIGEDAEVCAVSDDGSNVVWSEDKEGDIDVFMLENGVPERIGKLTNKRKYHHVSAQFFADGKSLAVYSTGSPSMLVSIDGSDVEEVSLPGVMGTGGLFDLNGNTIDSEDDNMCEFYLTVLNNDDSDVQSIYKWTPEGNMTEIASDIPCGDWTKWFEYENSSYYYLTDGYIYYVGNDGDFYKKALDEGGEPAAEKITTSVEAAYVPHTGGYAYVAKNGSIYYIDLSDKDNKLNIVCDGFTSDDLFFTTDKADVVYYILDMKDIGDTVWGRGTLYCYSIGGETVKIAEDIMDLRKKDSLTYSSETPIIQQYVSYKDSSLIESFGTMENGKFVVKVKNAKD